MSDSCCHHATDGTRSVWKCSGCGFHWCKDCLHDRNAPQPSSVGKAAVLTTTVAKPAAGPLARLAANLILNDYACSRPGCGARISGNQKIRTV